MLKLAAFTVAVLVPLSTTFSIDFSSDPGCAGGDLGTREIHQGLGCQTDFAGKAKGVTVTNNNATEEQDVVVFYGDKKCGSKSEVAVSNVGICVQADFGSYKAINASDCCLNSGVSQTPNSSVCCC